MYIRVDDDNGKVKVGDDYLPGILESVSVGGSIIYEKSNDKESKNKVMSGYEDKSISISMVIIDDDRNDKDRYEILEEVEKMFMKKKDSLPEIYTILHPHIQARNIDEVLMKSLSSSEDNSLEVISIDMEFIEFEAASYQLETKEEREIREEEQRSEKEKNFIQEEYEKGHELFSDVTSGGGG